MNFVEKLLEQLWVPFLYNIAKLIMGHFEVHFHKICKLKWGKDFTNLF